MARDQHGHELPPANTSQRYGQEIRLPDFLQNLMPEETPPPVEPPPRKLKKAEFAQVLHENPQIPDEPDDSYLSRIMDTAIPMALRILPAIGGSIVGGLGGSIPGLIAGGAAGSGFGEGLAQAYETSRGLREDFNPQQVAMQSFLGGIPLGAGKIASTGRLAAQSGLLGGGSTIGTSLAETGEMPSVPQFLMGTGLGTVMGAGAGKLAQRPMRNLAAGDPPLQGMLDFEDVTGAMPSSLRRGVEPQYAVPPQQQGLNVSPQPKPTYRPVDETMLGDIRGQQLVDDVSPAPIPRDKRQGDLVDIETGQRVPGLMNEPRPTATASKDINEGIDQFANISGKDAKQISDARRAAGVGGYDPKGKRWNVVAADFNDSPLQQQAFTQGFNSLARRGVEGMLWYTSVAEGAGNVFGTQSKYSKFLIDMFAATSPNTDVRENAIRALKLTARTHASPESGIGPPGLRMGRLSAESDEPTIAIQRAYENFMSDPANRQALSSGDARKINDFQEALMNELYQKQGLSPQQISTRSTTGMNEPVIDRHMMAMFGFDPGDQSAINKVYTGNAKTREEMGEFWRKHFTDDDGMFHEDLWKKYTRRALNAKGSGVKQRTTFQVQVTNQQGKKVWQTQQDKTGPLVADGTKTNKDRFRVMRDNIDGTEREYELDRIGTAYDLIAGDIEMKARTAARKIMIKDHKGEDALLFDVIGRDLGFHEYQSMVWNGFRSESQKAKIGSPELFPGKFFEEMSGDPQLPFTPRIEEAQRGLKRVPMSPEGERYGLRFTGSVPEDQKIMKETMNST